MPEETLVNRFSLDEPDWDLLDCDLSEGESTGEPEENRSNGCLIATAATILT
jgi:hypothetical protein